MTRTDRSDEYERIARETTWQVVTRLAEDVSVAADETASAVYWGDLDAEQIERLRQHLFDLQYATEEYLARVCDDAEPWGDAESPPAGRAPSWRPTDERPPWLRGERPARTPE
jgi:hypothetical protein